MPTFLLSLNGHVYFRYCNLTSNHSANFILRLFFFLIKLWLEFSNCTATLSFCVSSTFEKNAISQYITPRCRIHRWFISQNKCSETSAPNRGKTWNSLLPQSKNSPGWAWLNKVCFQLYFQILSTITARCPAATHAFEVLLKHSGTQGQQREEDHPWFLLQVSDTQSDKPPATALTLQACTAAGPTTKGASEFIPMPTSWWWGQLEAPAPTKHPCSLAKFSSHLCSALHTGHHKRGHTEPSQEGSVNLRSPLQVLICGSPSKLRQGMPRTVRLKTYPLLSQVRDRKKKGGGGTCENYSDGLRIL